jgi:SAM-dependent methyltransferase
METSIEAERAIPGETEAGTMAFHLARYSWSLQYCVGKRVLDAGCGVGYGSRILASVASEVVGIDYSQSAIERARAEHGGAAPALQFDVRDLHDVPYPGAPYDVVVCFEVLEHLAPGFDALRALATSLTKDGVALVSTPNDLTWRHLEAARYPHHINMRTPDQFVDEARTAFRDVELFGMRANGSAWYGRARSLDRRNLRLHLPRVVREAVRFVAGVRNNALTSSDVVIKHDQISQSHTLLMVCRRPLLNRESVATPLAEGNTSNLSDAACSRNA